MTESTNSKYMMSLFPHYKYSDLTMYQFGWEHCLPNNSLGPIATSHLLFHYVISGKGVFRVTDGSGIIREYELGPGQGFLMWPDNVCTYVSDSEEPWEYAWVEFGGLKAEELILEAGLNANFPIYIGENTREKELMASELTWIVNNPSRPSLELIGRFYVFLSALKQSSVRHAEITGASHHETHLKKALKYIGENYSQDIKIQEISDYCNVHRSYLFQIFMTYLNQSPLQYLIGVRIKKAREALRTTSKPVGEISAMVGYPNQMNCARAFKRVTGFTPQQWRKAGSI